MQVGDKILCKNQDTTIAKVGDINEIVEIIKYKDIRDSIFVGTQDGKVYAYVLDENVTGLHIWNYYTTEETINILRKQKLNSINKPIKIPWYKKNLLYLES